MQLHKLIWKIERGDVIITITGGEKSSWIGAVQHKFGR